MGKSKRKQSAKAPKHVRPPPDARDADDPVVDAARPADWSLYSTAALRAYCGEYEAFDKVKVTETSHTHPKLVAWLKKKKVPVASLDEVRDCYLSRHPSLVSVDTPMLAVDEHSGDASDHSAPDEAPPAKRHRVIEASPLVLASTFAVCVIGTPHQCRHCGTLDPSPSNYLCPTSACGFNRNEALNSPFNLDFARCKATSADGLSRAVAQMQSYQHAAASSSSAAAGTSGTSPTQTSTLSAGDKEYLRQSRDGLPYQRFELNGDGVSIEEAFMITGAAAGSRAYAMASPSMISLVGSGKIMYVGQASPHSIIASASSSSGGQEFSLMSNGNGGVSLSASAGKIPSTLSLGLTGYLNALFRTIIPSLITRPRALMDWVALSLSTLDQFNDPSGGWPAAAAYLDLTLADKVAHREQFGAFDATLFNEVMRSHARRPASTPAAASSHSNSTSSHSNSNSSSSQGSTRAGGNKSSAACHKWNFSDCTFGNCNYQHVCWYHARCSPGAPAAAEHKGVNCAMHDTKSVPAQPGAKGKSRSVVKATKKE